MSLETLDRSLSVAFSRRRSPVEKAPRRSPMDFSGGWVDYGSEDASADQEKFDHNCGRFYAAARIIVERLAARPIFAARIGNRKGWTVSAMMRKGTLPVGGFPAWLGNPDALEVAPVHPVLNALSDPNPDCTAHNMWQIIGGSLVVTGKAYRIALKSSTRGRAWDLYPLPSTWVTQDEKAGKWYVKPPGSLAKAIEVPHDQVEELMIADPSCPGKALSPMKVMARAVLTDEAIASAQYQEFKNGGMPKVALIAGDVMNETSFTDDANRTSAARPVRLEPEQRRQIVTWFKQQYQGVQKHGLPIVLDAVIRDIKLLSHKPAEMGFLDSTNVTKEQIFEGLGVPKVLLGQFDDVNRASAGIADTIFVENVLNPIINLISQVMTKKLGPLFSVGSERLVVWMAPAMPKDSELDMDYLKTGVRAYALKRNEVRDILRTRFGGLPWLPEFESVVIPEKLDERFADSETMGVGRVTLEQPEVPDEQE